MRSASALNAATVTSTSHGLERRTAPPAARRRPRPSERERQHEQGAGRSRQATTCARPSARHRPVMTSPSRSEQRADRGADRRADGDRERAAPERRRPCPADRRAGRARAGARATQDLEEVPARSVRAPSPAAARVVVREQVADQHARPVAAGRRGTGTRSRRRPAARRWRPPGRRSRARSRTAPRRGRGRRARPSRAPAGRCRRPTDPRASPLGGAAVTVPSAPPLGISTENRKPGADRQSASPVWGTGPRRAPPVPRRGRPSTARGRCGPAGGSTST